jgi:hypothetical protein
VNRDEIQIGTNLNKTASVKIKLLSVHCYNVADHTYLPFVILNSAKPVINYDGYVKVYHHILYLYCTAAKHSLVISEVEKQ